MPSLGRKPPLLMGRDVPGLYLLSARRNGVAECPVLVLVNNGLESVIFQPNVRYVYFWILKYS